MSTVSGLRIELYEAKAEIKRIKRKFQFVAGRWDVAIDRIAELEASRETLHELHRAVQVLRQRMREGSESAA